jgi:hypothetical protein
MADAKITLILSKNEAKAFLHLLEEYTVWDSEEWPFTQEEDFILAKIRNRLFGILKGDSKWIEEHFPRKKINV